MVQECNVIVGLKCPFCGRDVFLDENVPCCNLLLSWVWPNENAYTEWYRTSSYHENQYKLNRGRTCSELYGESRNAARERLRFLEPFRTKATNHLLDIGAGSGAFRDEADFQGYHAVGIDPNPLGTVVYGEWKDVTGHWDVLTMWDVLEHIVNPREVLGHLKLCLAEDGLLWVEMPEFMAPGDWERHKKPMEHVILYSKSAAERLYEEEGFEVVMFLRPLRGSLGKMCHALRRK